jgi:hypothetical protein
MRLSSTLAPDGGFPADSLENYLSADMISPTRQSASWAIVPTIIESFRNAGATHACLRCSARINLNQLAGVKRWAYPPDPQAVKVRAGF